MERGACLTPCLFLCVISKFNDGFEAVGGHAVMSEQGVQERTEQAALGGAGAESHSENVVLPIHTGVEPKVSMLGDELQGHDGIEL